MGQPSSLHLLERKRHEPTRRPCATSSPLRPPLGTACLSDAGDKRDVLHVRVVAPLELRVAYVVHREGLDLDAARRRVQAKDRARTRYMQTEYHCQHEDPHLYDLVIDTAVLDLDSAVDLICLALA